MKTEIDSRRVNAYRRQIQARRDSNVPWDIALDIVCDTVIEQGKEIAKLRTALEKIAYSGALAGDPKRIAVVALKTPSGTSIVL